MLLERYYDDALAQASYLVGCEEAGEAIVIDPNRDIERYTRAAAARGMRITHVTETHIHADYLSGSRDLARAARATLVLSNHGGTDWRYGFAAADGARLVRNGDTISVGKVRLAVLHTPGHTPEHICLVVTDTATGSHPMGMFSGDFVFVGDVGRPDLLERAANVRGTMEGAARQLHASLQRLSTFPDYLQIWPGHGAGSACGKALGAVPQTTLGYERLYNPALQHPSEAAFAEWVLSDQPEPPAYFGVMKRMNRDGPPARPTSDVPDVDLDFVEHALDAGHWLVDIRGSADFARGHLAGTINIPMSNSLVTYAGTVLSYDRPIVLIAKSRDQALSATRHLTLIGFDRISGVATREVLERARQAGRAMAVVRRVEPRTVAEQLVRGSPLVIDVRGRSEWNDGHLKGATHIYLGELEERARSLDKTTPIVLHCRTTTRSSIGASLLLGRGFGDVSCMTGGMDAWRQAGLPVIEEKR